MPRRRPTQNSNAAGSRSAAPHQSPIARRDACESYVVYEAVEAPKTFICVEEWASRDGLYANLNTPHFTEFFAALGEVIAEPPKGTVSEVSSMRTLGEALASAGVGG